MTIRISLKDYEPEWKDQKVESIETWWESAHREWTICLKDSDGTPIEYRYARNRLDRDEQVAILKEIHNI